jgi:hypothetical protein
LLYNIFFIQPIAALCYTILLESICSYTTGRHIYMLPFPSRLAIYGIYQTALDLRPIKPLLRGLPSFPFS